MEAIGDPDATSIPKYGPLPVSVPGAVDGWCALHERFGVLPLEEVLAPAIASARGGAPITELIAHYWNLSAGRLKKWPGFSETFLPGGRAPRKGEVFANPALAKTLEAIAEGGRAGFYEGRVAREIAAYMKENGGFLTYEDLRDPPRRVGPAGVGELPRPRRLGAPAQRPGHRGPADAPDPRGLRHRLHGLRLRGLPARVHRGQEARLRRPRALLRRPELRPRARRGADLRGVRREEARDDR